MSAASVICIAVWWLPEVGPSCWYFGDASSFEACDTSNTEKKQYWEPPVFLFVPIASCCN